MRGYYAWYRTGAAYVTLILLVSFSRQVRAGVCCRGVLWVIDGSDTRGESAPRAGAVCKRGGKNPRAESDSRGESDPRAGAKCKRGN